MLIPVLFAMLIGTNLLAWSRFRINYVFIFGKNWVFGSIARFLIFLCDRVGHTDTPGLSPVLRGDLKTPYDYTPFKNYFIDSEYPTRGALLCLLAVISANRSAVSFSHNLAPSVARVFSRSNGQSFPCAV